jgi:hypothetical protein
MTHAVKDNLSPFRKRQIRKILTYENTPSYIQEWWQEIEREEYPEIIEMLVDRMTERNLKIDHLYLAYVYSYKLYWKYVICFIDFLLSSDLYSDSFISTESRDSVMKVAMSEFRDLVLENPEIVSEFGNNVL